MAMGGKSKKYLVWWIAGAVILALALSAGGYFGYYAFRGIDKISNVPEKFSKFALDPSTLPKDFKKAVKAIRKAQKWDLHRADIKSDSSDPASLIRLKMTRAMLEKSYDLGSAFLVKNQTPEGNFYYQYDWISKTYDPSDHQTRQAGALWGVALCYQHKQTPEAKAVLDKGLKYFFDRTIEGPEKSLLFKYKNDPKMISGTIALVGLSIIEYLRTDQSLPPDYKKELTQKLEGYLNFLKWMQLDNGHFSKEYTIDGKERSKKWLGYYDGESLLCLCKAAKYLGYKDLIPVIEKAARATAEFYTVTSWKKKQDPDETKSFYQWGSMSYLEYVDAGWKDADLFADVTLALSWWMVHTHEVLKKGRNTAYALEGLISAYHIADKRKDIKAMVDLLYAIDRNFDKLTAWQVGGPLAKENPFLVANPTDDKMAIGGVMNEKDKAPLRIDVTQHQMHSVIMALDYAYKSGSDFSSAKLPADKDD